MPCTRSRNTLHYMLNVFYIKNQWYCTETHSISPPSLLISCSGQMWLCELRCCFSASLWFYWIVFGRDVNGFHLWFYASANVWMRVRVCSTFRSIFLWASVGALVQRNTQKVLISNVIEPYRDRCTINSICNVMRAPIRIKLDKSLNCIISRDTDEKENGEKAKEKKSIERSYNIRIEIEKKTNKQTNSPPAEQHNFLMHTLIIIIIIITN